MTCDFPEGARTTWPPRIIGADRLPALLVRSSRRAVGAVVDKTGVAQLSASRLSVFVKIVASRAKLPTHPSPGQRPPSPHPMGRRQGEGCNYNSPRRRATLAL